MKKIFFISAIIVSVFIISSCNTSKNKKQKLKNNLIAKNVIASYEFDLYPEVSEWIKTLDKKFVSIEIDKSLSQEIKTYNDDDNLMSVNSIKQNLGILTDTQLIEQENGEMKMNIIKSDLDINSIKSLYFKEKWFYNQDSSVFTKNIIWYSPVRYYYKYDTIKYTKRWIYRIKNDNFNKKTSKQIAKNIIYEVDFNVDTSTTQIEGLDNKQFVDILINNAINKKIKCYDAMSTKELTVEQINNELGNTTDTIFVEDPETGEISTKIAPGIIDKSEIKGLMFIENWYLDTVSFNIRKEILGIAPIRFVEKYFEDSEKPEITKKIPFVYYFTNKKPNIF